MEVLMLIRTKKHNSYFYTTKTRTLTPWDLVVDGMTPGSVTYCDV